MNVEIQMAEKKKYNRFPIMAKCTNEDMLLLFTSEKEGIMLKGEDHEFVGEKIETVYSVYDKSKWEILPEGSKVILEQPRILL